MKRQRSYASSGQPNKYRRGNEWRPPSNRPTYIVPSPRVVPGYTRTVGAYKRSIPGNIEKKFFDTACSDTSDMSGGAIVAASLNLIPQGTTDQTRVGNKITIRNVNVRFAISADDQTTGAFAAGAIRIIIYVDKQTNGATAAFTDILKGGQVTSFRNMDQVDRFIILKDKIYAPPVMAANALHTSTSARYYSISKKVNLPVHFSSTTGAITELRSNNIGFLAISDTASANIFNGVARVKFTDD